MTTHPLNQRDWPHRPYWISLAARLSVGLLCWAVTYFGLLSSPLLEDALSYEAEGAAIADEWLSGNSSETLHELMSANTRAWGLPLVLGSFYFLTGGIRALPVLIAAYGAITAWTPVYTYHLARQLGAPSGGARMAGWLVTLSPAFAFWSGSLYKEGFILLLLTMAIYHTLMLQETGAWRSLGIVVACLPAPACAAVLPGDDDVRRAAGHAAGPRPRRSLRLSGRLVALIFGTLLVGVSFTDRVQNLMPEDLDTDSLRSTVPAAISPAAGSGYYRDVDVSTPWQMLSLPPIGLVISWPPLSRQFAPGQNLAIPETLVWVCLYPYLLLGISRAGRHWQGRSS